MASGTHLIHTCIYYEIRPIFLNTLHIIKITVSVLESGKGWYFLRQDVDHRFGIQTFAPIQVTIAEMPVYIEWNIRSG